MDAGDYIAIGALFVSIVFSTLAVISSRKARKSAEFASKEANRSAELSSQLQALEWTTQYFEGVRVWGSEVTQVMTNAMNIHLIKDSEAREIEWYNLRSSLSAAVDTGRWYFPNKYVSDFGIKKPIAYRGLRRKILDYIVHAFDTLNDMPEYFFDADPSTKKKIEFNRKKIEKFKREFVSELQEILNPRKREKQIETVITNFGVSDMMRTESDKT